MLHGKIIQALEALAENGTACIDGDDRALFAETARVARVENNAAHLFDLPASPETKEERGL